MKNKKPNYNDKIMKENPWSTEEVVRETVHFFKLGVKAAADVANDYNSSSTHSYMLGDCILAKLNQIGNRKLRKNKKKLKVSK